MEKIKIYGYAIESYNEIICPNTKIDCGYWTRYNRKVYDTEEIAKDAIEQNPYFKNGYEGFMNSYKIITLYKKEENEDEKN